MSSTHILLCASTPNIQGKNRVREQRSHGSVRGVLSNRHPYRDLVAQAGPHHLLKGCAHYTLLIFGCHQPNSSLHSLFRGEWAPAKARCTSPLKLIIGANVITFVKDADRDKIREEFSGRQTYSLTVALRRGAHQAVRLSLLSVKHGRQDGLRSGSSR